MTFLQPMMLAALPLVARAGMPQAPVERLRILPLCPEKSPRIPPVPAMTIPL